MKLTMKMMVWMTGLLILVVAGESLFSLRREVAQIDEDLERDGRLVAESLRVVAEDAELTPSRIDALLGSIAHAEPGMSASLVQATSVSPPVAAALQAHHQRVHGVFDPDGRRFTTYAAVSAEPAGRLIRVTQSTAHRDRHIRASLVQTAVVSLAALLLAVAVSTFLGRRRVGRPLRALVHGAQRVARLEPHAPIQIDTGDELTELADAMNTMSRTLDEARAKAAEETEERIVALQQLRHAERLTTVGRIAAGIAHELGTPLNVIDARAQIISRDAADEARVVSNAKIIREQAVRITKVVRQLLDFARPEATTRQPVAVRPLVERSLAAVEPLAHAAKVTLEVARGGESLLVDADPTQLSQVVTNLVVNAIDAMEDGGPVKVGVERAFEARPGTDEEIPCVRIRVGDRGPGMTPDVAEHLFDPFFTTKDVGAGTGLGLAVSYGIVKEHGGWFDVHTVLGQGSRIDAYLPEANKA